MNGIKEFRVTLTDNLHKEFKEACNGRPLIQVIIYLIKKFIEDSKKETK